MAGIEWIIILMLLIVLGIVLFLYIRQEKRIESRAHEIFEAWQGFRETGSRRVEVRSH